MARLADVHGVSPESFGPPGVAASRKELWIAVRAALRSVVAQGNIADLATGTPPAGVAALLDDPDAWMRRPDPSDRPAGRPTDGGATSRAVDRVILAVLDPVTVAVT